MRWNREYDGLVACDPTPAHFRNQRWAGLFKPCLPVRKYVEEIRGPTLELIVEFSPPRSGVPLL